MPKYLYSVKGFLISNLIKTKSQGFFKLHIKQILERKYYFKLKHTLECEL